MSFVSSDEEDQVENKIGTSVPDTSIAPTSSISKPVSSFKPVPIPINSSKPVPTPINSSKPVPKSITSSKPAPTPVNSTKPAPSPIFPTESLKRKKSAISSPECNFDLTSEFECLPEPDKLSLPDKSTDHTDPTPSYKLKLQQFVFKTEEEKPESSGNVENILETTAPLCSASPRVAGHKSRLSTGKRARLSSGQILRYSSPASEVEKENSEDRAMVQLMLKRRRESGKAESVDPEFVLEAPGIAGLVLETPDEMDDFDLGSDFEEESEFAASKTTALVDVSNQALGTRKLLFKPEVSQPAPASSPTVIYSSGDDVWPEDRKQIQPSLSSADEIDEPEDIFRRVKQPDKKKLTKRKKKSEGGKRSFSKGRLSLTLGSSMQGENSDDDFM